MFLRTRLAIGQADGPFEWIQPRPRVIGVAPTYLGFIVQSHKFVVQVAHCSAERTYPHDVPS